MRRRRPLHIALAVTLLASLWIGTAAGAVTAPPNDDIADATTIGSLPYEAAGTNEGATDEDGEYTNCGQSDESVWYSFTADEARLILVEATEENIETSITIYKGGPDAGVGDITRLGCWSEWAVISTVPGTTYYIRVASWDWAGSQTGDFTLRVFPIDNQDFADATVLDGLPSYLRGFNAIDAYYIFDEAADLRAPILVEFDDGIEEGEPQPCGAIGATMWYRFTAEADAPMTANTFDVSNDAGGGILDPSLRTDFDTVLAVYTGPADATFGDLVLLGCNDDYGQGVSRVDFDATAGATYWFQVGGFNASFEGGPFRADISGPFGVFDLTVSALCQGRPATIVGTAGADTLIGTRKRDVISGLGGNDFISGRKGRDIICGGGGMDTILGGSGADKIRGDSGNDLLIGHLGDDVLWGGLGDDEADGGGGTDVCDAETTSGCEG